MGLELSPLIDGDPDDIAAYIAEDNPHRAVTFIREVRAKFAAIAREPLIHQLRPEIGDAARIANVGRHAILLRIVGDVARIERVTYGGRDLPALFDSP
jgi:toxin ParE1/3/4